MRIWLIALFAALPLGTLVAGEIEHAGHHAQTERNTSVSLSAEGPVQAGQPISLAIRIKGAGPLEFETFQEQRLHLILISSNMVYFRHLHPQYRGEGLFALNTTLPFGGAYRLFLDYRPKGYGEQIKELSLLLSGSRPKATLPDPSVSTAKLGDITVNINSAKIAAGQPARLSFEVTQNGQPLTTFEPYLGERGHLVIIRRSLEGDVSDYQHAHALESTGPLDFATNLPTPGLYKLWLQFKAGGKLNTAEFWIKAE